MFSYNFIKYNTLKMCTEEILHAIMKVRTIFDRRGSIIWNLEKRYDSYCEKFPIHALSEEPFMLLEKGDKTEISE